MRPRESTRLYSPAQLLRVPEVGGRLGVVQQAAVAQEQPAETQPAEQPAVVAQEWVL